VSVDRRPPAAQLPPPKAQTLARAVILQGGAVVATMAALGWVSPLIDLVVATSLAMGLVVGTPALCGWSAAVQGGVTLVGILAFAGTLPSALPSSPSLVGTLAALLVGGAVSTAVASGLSRQRLADLADRNRTVDRLRQAVAGMARRGGLVTIGVGANEPEVVANVDRIVADLDKAGLETEQLRAQFDKDLRREQEAGSQFVGQAAHEFRTPLSVIQTAAEALRLYAGRMSSHAQQARIANIEASVQQMGDLLRNALTFSKAEARQIKCERQAVDLRAMTQEVVRDVQANFGERNISISIRGSARLPQLDPSLTREILSNLLTNAVKYSPAGEPIEVEVITGPMDVHIRVTDHGIGISEEDLPYLFDPFRRGANVGDIPGTGLGLAITKRSIEVHGGSIKAESEPGEGTTFTVTLIERVEPGDRSLSRPDLQPGSGAREGGAHGGTRERGVAAG